MVDTLAVSRRGFRGRDRLRETKISAMAFANVITGEILGFV